MARVAARTWIIAVCLTTVLLYVSWCFPDSIAGRGTAFLWPSALATHQRDSRDTSHYAGVPGFQVFDNLWYRNRAFYAFTDSRLDVYKDDVVNTPSAFFIRPASERPGNDLETRVHLIQGVSIWDNSHHSVFPMLLAWYYHFASETVLGAVSALSAAAAAAAAENENPSATRFGRKIEPAVEDEEQVERLARLDVGVPDRMIIPWVRDWRDQYGIEQVLTDGIWGDALMEPDEWEQLENGGQDWILFERVVITDRQISTHHPLVQIWNKMALGAFNLPHRPAFFEPVRQKLLSSLHLQSSLERYQESKRSGEVKIVYVDRQDTSRRLTDEGQEDLLEVLRALESEIEGVRMEHGLFGKIGVEQQIEAVSDADIIIGVHGNGLTHQLWMPSGGSVIELFAKDAFLRDYQVVAEALGHTHICFREDEVLHREQWEKIQGELNPGYLHDWRRLSLDRDLIEKVLRTEIERVRKAKMAALGRPR